MTGQGPDWKTLLAQAQPPRKTVRLCLRGDLAAEYRDAVDGGDAEAAQRLRAELEAATVDFVIQGLSRQAYRLLESQHPDPSGEMKWNPDTFPEALLRACLVTPQVPADEPLIDALTEGQAEDLLEAAFNVCNRVDDLPLPRRG